VYIERQEGNIISVTSVEITGRYTDRWTDTDGNTGRQQGDLINLPLFILNKENRLKVLLQMLHARLRNALFYYGEEHKLRMCKSSILRKYI
jgi:hypothetical protein